MGAILIFVKARDQRRGGRAYSSAYVEFVHYAERLYEAAQSLAPAHGH